MRDPERYEPRRTLATTVQVADEHGRVAELEVLAAPVHLLADHPRLRHDPGDLAPAYASVIDEAIRFNI